jgi:hypothetical protein
LLLPGEAVPGRLDGTQVQLARKRGMKRALP